MKFLKYTCEERFRGNEFVSYELVEEDFLKDLKGFENLKGKIISGRIELLKNANTHIKNYVRINFYSDNFEKSPRNIMKEEVIKFLAENGVPEKCTFEADIFCGYFLHVENRVDEFGHVDGIA